MKRILSVLCVLALIASSICFTAFASSAEVAFKLEASPVKDGDTTVTADLIVTLPEGATGYELGAYAVEVSYDADVMTLAEEPTWAVAGTTMNGESLESAPYMLIWCSINPEEQYKAGDTVAATLKFNLASPAVAGDMINIDLAMEEANLAVTMPSKDGAYAETKYTEDQLSATGATVIVTGEPVPPEEAIVDFALVADPVAVGDTAINVNLVVTLPEGATGYELGSFGVKVQYDDTVMTLAEEPYPEHKGTFQFSQNTTDNPYSMMWVSINPRDQFVAGDNVAIPMTFNLKEAAVEGAEYTIELLYDTINGASSMASQDGTYVETKYSITQLAFTSANIVVENAVVYGDVNDDGSVNLADVSLVLQHIASWEGVTINETAADVNVDGGTTLADVSLMLQYIASWEGIVLGPQA